MNKKWFVVPMVFALILSFNSASLSWNIDSMFGGGSDSLPSLTTDQLKQEPPLIESLRGFKEIQVVVEDINDPIVSRRQIQTDVESKLRMAGIKVVKDTYGWLYVNVNIMRVKGAAHYIYTVFVGFNQAATLVKSGQYCFATTWIQNILGITPESSIQEVIRSIVKNKVDEFINDYLTVNPI